MVKLRIFIFKTWTDQAFYMLKPEDRFYREPMTDQSLESAEIPQIVNLTQVDITSVYAEMVRTNQTIIQTLNTEEADLQASLTGTIQSGELHIQDSIIGAVASHQASFNGSLAIGGRSENLSYSVVARQVVAKSIPPRI
jgi:hypothetical protein